MGRYNKGSMPESIRYLRSEAQYFDDLIIIEAERIVLNAMALVQYGRGFTYLEQTATPVMPYDDDCYLPDDKLSREERGGLMINLTKRSQELVKQLGEENVWIGPYEVGRPLIPGLTPSEHRGLWTRFPDDWK